MPAVASRTEEIPAFRPEFQATPAGLLVRAAVAGLIAAIVFLVPVFTDTVWDDRVGLAAIFAIIGLSINVLTGSAGQVSLGHQAFVGIGAFMSAFMVKTSGVHAAFFIALPVAGLVGAAMAFALGLVALRIRGLYLALVTLAFGLVAQETIFNWRQFTGGGAGAPAPRPAGFESNQAYAYLCLLVLGFFLLIDWRLAKTKAGRAIVSLRANERVAATIGVNVTGYKLLAFSVSGFIAGVAGAMFAHQTRFVYANNFDFTTALVWVIMAVVGGLGSRAGVVVASAFFALFPFLLQSLVHLVDKNASDVTLASYTPLLGAVLLLVTLTRYPGGIGQQLLPIRRWLSGGPLRHLARPGLPSGPAVSAQETDAEPTADETAITVPVPPMPAPATRRGLHSFRRRKRG